VTSGPLSGLIDFYLHPPIGLLEPQLDFFGPYSGQNTRTEWSSTAGPIFTPVPVSATYGVQLQLNGAIPSGWGLTNGWVSDDGQYDESIYQPPLAQLVVQHRFPNGAWITTQVQWIETFPTVVLWAVSLPGRLGLYVAPRLTFDLFYLVQAGT